MKIRKVTGAILWILCRTFMRLRPSIQVRTPVYFTFELSAAVLTIIVLLGLSGKEFSTDLGYLCINLWSLVILCNFCEAIFEYNEK